MSQQMTVVLLLLVAFAAANMPFLNHRTFALIPRKADAGRKPFAQQLLEWIVLYGLIGLFSLMLERHAGQIYPQGWQFYATTLCLFATFAFPGFVYSHLWRQHH